VSLAAECVRHRARGRYVIIRVAGTGASGVGGDDGPATDARLSAPTATTATADGFLLVDRGSRTVHKVESTG
jgi:hypothetical protein